MVTITRWTGRQARILREVALRMTIYEFAAHTNLSTSTIRDMENKGEQAHLRTSTQKILDETLAAAPEHAQKRFATALANTTDPTDDTATTGQIVTAPSQVPQPRDVPGPVLEVTDGHQGDRFGGYGTLSDTDTLPGQHGSVEDDEVNRRNLLATGGAVAAGAFLSAPTRVVQALGVAVSDGADSIAATVDHLDELVWYYSEAVCRIPSTKLYDEMQGIRLYTGSLLARTRRRANYSSDLTVAAGWLSNILAVAASYLGDHTAALVWCSDAERRSREAGHPELAGWAVLTKAMIAYYQGRTDRSVALAVSGQQVAPEGTVVRAKLAAQEMRARAMLGDADGMAQAERQAATAIARVPAGAAASGAFSIPLAPDPPYTATSLLLVGKFEEAAAATGRVLDTVYHGSPNYQGRRTSNYARALLVLGLAEAGLGRAAEAAAAGNAALSAARLVWPTMVLADKLDQVLMSRFSGVAEARDYHDFYAAASHDLPHRTDVSEDRE